MFVCGQGKRMTFFSFFIGFILCFARVVFLLKFVIYYGKCIVVRCFCIDLLNCDTLVYYIVLAVQLYMINTR